MCLSGVWLRQHSAESLSLLSYPPIAPGTVLPSQLYTSVNAACISLPSELPHFLTAILVAGACFDLFSGFPADRSHWLWLPRSSQDCTGF